MKKTLKKFLAASIAAGSFIFTPPIYNADLIQIVQAEIKTYTGVGECVQGDLITLEQAKNYAKLKAELNAKEQAGVYIANYSKTENFNLTENKIDLITNSIVNIVGEVQYKTETTMFGNSPVVKYVATLSANIDTDGINKYIRRDDGQKAQSELQSATKDIKDGLNKIDELIERYNKATSQAEKDKIRAEFSDADRKVLAGQKNDEGIEFANKGEYQKAIELYNEALAFNPNYAYAYNNRGNAYYYLKQYDAAIADYNKAIQINPNYDHAYNNRGNVYFDLKQYYAAIDDYNKAIEINPNDAAAYYNRGIAYGNLKQYDAAIADFSKAIEINPNYAAAYYNRGCTYDDLKQYDAAIADYNKAIKLNPNDAEAYNNRGLAYKNLKQYDAAIADYNKAIQLNPNKAGSYHNRGIAYALKGNFQQAIKDATKAIGINPNDAIAYQLRGICYRELGETEKSNADFAKAKQFG